MGRSQQKQVPPTFFLFMQFGAVDSSAQVVDWLPVKLNLVFEKPLALWRGKCRSALQNDR